MYVLNVIPFNQCATKLTIHKEEQPGNYTRKRSNGVEKEPARQVIRVKPQTACMAVCVHGVGPGVGRHRWRATGGLSPADPGIPTST